MRPLLENKEGRVGGGGDKAELPDEGGEALVLGPRSLLQSVQGLLQEADAVGGTRVDEAWWLLAVDSLLEMTVKESILHVQLVDRPGARCGDAEDGPNGGRFDHRAEGIVVVDALALREAADHPASLVAGKRSIGVELVSEEPFSRHDVGTGGTRDELPGVVVDKSLVLIRHRCAPVGIGQRAAIVRWERRGRG